MIPSPDLWASRQSLMIAETIARKLEWVVLSKKYDRKIDNPPPPWW